MWWLVALAFAVGLGLGYWSGTSIGEWYFFGWWQGTNEAERDVIWCYRNILHRHPESREMILKWSPVAAQLGRVKLAREFMRSTEFQRQVPDDRRVAEYNFDNLKRDMTMKAAR